MASPLKKKMEEKIALGERAEMLRAALPGWRRRREEVVVECGSLPTGIIALWPFSKEPSVEEVWSELLDVGPPDRGAINKRPRLNSRREGKLCARVRDYVHKYYVDILKKPSSINCIVSTCFLTRGGGFLVLC